MSPPSRRGVQRLDGARVAVWGTGAEGRAVVALARARGASVTVVDDRPVLRPGRPAGGGAAADLGAAGPVGTPDQLADGGFDVVVRSPGVSRYRPELRAAATAGAAVTTLTALWLEDFADAPVVAVTGSKGKTTTAVLAAAALRATGRTVAVGGNMGRPLAELYGPGGVPGGGADAYVVEVSSFQAAEVTVSPPVGVLTLLAPDHLDWHGTYERYVADKTNLFAHRRDMVVAVNATDPPAWEAAARFPGRTGYGAPATALSVGEGGVHVDGRPYLGADELAAARIGLRGAHNLVNLCGALTAARALVGELPAAADLRRQLDATEPLGSRLRTVAAAGGVEFVDDALASNPAGAVAALRAFAGRPVCLLAGGADRAVSLAPLVAELRALDPPPAVVTLGDAGARLASELAGSVRCQAAPSVEAAVRRAVALLAGPGVVLLSPAAPTPPAEGTYVQRSARFAAAAAAEAARLGGPAGGAGGPADGAAPRGGGGRC